MTEIALRFRWPCAATYNLITAFRCSLIVTFVTTAINDDCCGANPGSNAVRAIARMWEVPRQMAIAYGLLNTAGIWVMIFLMPDRGGTGAGHASAGGLRPWFPP